MTEDYELKDDVHRQQYEFRIGNYTENRIYKINQRRDISYPYRGPAELEGKG